MKDHRQSTEAPSNSHFMYSSNLLIGGGALMLMLGVLWRRRRERNERSLAESDYDSAYEEAIAALSVETTKSDE